MKKSELIGKKMQFSIIVLCADKEEAKKLNRPHDEYIEKVWNNGHEVSEEALLAEHMTNLRFNFDYNCSQWN